MNYVIHPYEYEVVHRGQVGFLSHLIRDLYGEHGNHEMLVVQFTNDQKWYIVPANVNGEEEIEDVGPFDEVDDALLIFRLMCDVY